MPALDAAVKEVANRRGSVILPTRRVIRFPGVVRDRRRRRREEEAELAIGTVREVSLELTFLIPLRADEDGGERAPLLRAPIFRFTPRAGELRERAPARADGEGITGIANFKEPPRDPLSPPCLTGALRMSLDLARRPLGDVNDVAVVHENGVVRAHAP